ncbi:hypothetical protein ADIS_0990 [Lunatimonas lonarensis]|uniref:Uncharacterized protein n=1 Tax=Lunatimonas lonarensis TaxID=1232681 RepID=R7ZWL0_9BACT|nr:hypothetical protein ADIS_0990 [Lunatimonas lonarensis]
MIFLIPLIQIFELSPEAPNRKISRIFSIVIEELHNYFRL